MEFLEKETWEVIKTYFRDNKHYLIKHHLDSYNDFIMNKIPQTLKQFNPLTIYLGNKSESSGEFRHNVSLYFGGKEGNEVFLSQPVVYDVLKDKKRHMFPNEARLKNLSYASHLLCNIYVEYKTIDNELITETFKNVQIGLIPIMLKSNNCLLHNQPNETLVQMGECPYDQGGYFIIDGAEKIIVSHERKAENKVYIVKYIPPVENENRENMGWLYSAIIKSSPEGVFMYPRTTTVSITKDDKSIEVIVRNLSKPIPLFIIFRAFNF